MYLFLKHLEAEAEASAEEEAGVKKEFPCTQQNVLGATKGIACFSWGDRERERDVCVCIYRHCIKYTVYILCGFYIYTYIEREMEKQTGRQTHAEKRGWKEEPCSGYLGQGLTTGRGRGRGGGAQQLR
jgi:hypothetical protein